MAVITVSRTPASGGDELARALAERLQYRLVDRQELIRLAAELGGPAALESSPEMRERSPSFWERLNEERRRYFSVLRSTVIQLAAQDNVVIVGLGAGQLLKGLSHVLRVQVVAPTNVRLERLMESGDESRPGPLTREQARDLLRSRDREAAGYIRYLFNIDWLEAHQWDLVINTGRLTTSQGAEAISAIVGTGVIRMATEEASRLKDLTLATRVEMALLNQSSVWVNGLRVTSKNGVIQLEGEVMADEDRDIAEQLVQPIEGVQGVENELRIQPPPLTGM